MLQKHARLIFVLSILLLALVTLDFTKIVGQSTSKQAPKAKTNLVEKVDQIGQVLGSCNPCLIFEFYLKDATDNSYISNATVSLVTREPFDFSSFNLPEFCKNLGCIYSLDASADGGSLKNGYSFPTTVQVSIVRNGYVSKTAIIQTGSVNVDTVYLEKITVALPPPPPPAATITKKTVATPEKIETIKDIVLPSEFKEPQAETTDLSKISDISKVSDLKIGSSINTIKFKDNIDLSAIATKDKFKQLDKYVKTASIGLISIDSANLPALNKPATLTMKGLSFVKTPRVLVNGKEDGTVVMNIKYQDGVLTFDVTHFSTFTVAPTVVINEPASNFETNNKSLTLKGTVSDPNASVSAKLNNKSLGKLKLATSSGEFKTGVSLEKGINKIVVTALSANGAFTIATVSGTLLAEAKSNVGLYWLIFLLALIAGFGVAYSAKHLRKKIAKASENPIPTNPPANL